MEALPIQDGQFEANLAGEIVILGLSVYRRGYLSLVWRVSLEICGLLCALLEANLAEETWFLGPSPYRRVGGNRNTEGVGNFAATANCLLITPCSYQPCLVVPRRTPKTFFKGIPLARLRNSLGPETASFCAVATTHLETAWNSYVPQHAVIVFKEANGAPDLHFFDVLLLDVH